MATTGAMNKLVQRRKWLKSTITRAAETVSGSLEEQSQEMLLNHINRLENTFNEFNESCQLMYEFAEVEGFIDPMVNFPTYESRYYKAHAAISKCLSAFANNQVQHTQNDSLDRLVTQQESFFERLSCNEKPSLLSTIKIPIFSGDYADWPSFRDLFQSAVATKRSLTDVQRFHYLKTNLNGDALQLIKHLPITDGNYATAWERLVKRYDRKSFIIKSFVLTLLSLPGVQVSNANSLRKLSDSADEVLRGLDAINATTRDPWLIQILLSKTDDDTKRCWAEKSDGSAPKLLSEFMDFLAHRCDILESLPSHRMQRKVTVAHHVTPTLPSTANKGSSCSLCAQPHSLSQCLQFKAFTWQNAEH